MQAEKEIKEMRWVTLKDIQRHLADHKKRLIEKYEYEGELPPFDVLYGDGRQPKGFPSPEEYLEQRYNEAMIASPNAKQLLLLPVCYPPCNARPMDAMGEPVADDAPASKVQQPPIRDGVQAAKAYGRKLAVPDPRLLEISERNEYLTALRLEMDEHTVDAQRASDVGDYDRAEVYEALADEVRIDILRMQSRGDVWSALVNVGSHRDPAVEELEEHVSKLDAALQGAIRTMHQIMQHNQAPQYGPIPEAPPPPPPHPAGIYGQPPPPRR